MKKNAYIIFFFALSVCFVMVYYAGYYYATKKIDQGDIVKFNNSQVTNNDIDGNIKSVDLDDSKIISKDTRYILESYNVETDEINKETQDLPIALIGLKREELINYISKNTSDFANDGEEVINVQLISFSNKSIVLRRSFTNIDIGQYSYWLKDKNGFVIVYKSDKETVYFNTSIDSSLLPEDVRYQLYHGINIKDIHELYNFLESFTS